MTLRVLVVDDEPLVAEAVRAFLEDEGMRVQTADSAEAALEAVRAGGAFDACIMDLRLPGMNGDKAAQALRSLCPGLLFVFHTASTDRTVPAQLAAIGIGEPHLFKKPLADMMPLAETLRSLAGRRAARPS